MEAVQTHEPWNKGKLVGQKAPLKLKDIWAIRIHLQLDQSIRELALFNLAVDSNLSRGIRIVRGMTSAMSFSGASPRILTTWIPQLMKRLPRSALWNRGPARTLGHKPSSAACPQYGGSARLNGLYHG